MPYGSGTYGTQRGRPPKTGAKPTKILKPKRLKKSKLKKK
jgi:hypothetical protein